jgi:hypothetical protein
MIKQTFIDGSCERTSCIFLCYTMAKQYMFDFSNFFCNHPVLQGSYTSYETSQGQKLIGVSLPTAASRASTWDFTLSSVVTVTQVISCELLF